MTVTDLILLFVGFLMTYRSYKYRKRAEELLGRLVRMRRRLRDQDEYSLRQTGEIMRLKKLWEDVPCIMHVTPRAASCPDLHGVTCAYCRLRFSAAQRPD